MPGNPLHVIQQLVRAGRGPRPKLPVYPPGSIEALLSQGIGDPRALVSGRPQPTNARYPDDNGLARLPGLNRRDIYPFDIDQRRFVDAALSDVLDMGMHPSWINGVEGFAATRPNAGFGHASFFPRQLGRKGVIGIDESYLRTAMAMLNKDPRGAQTIRGFLCHELGHCMDDVQNNQITGNKGPLAYRGMFFDPKIEVRGSNFPIKSYYEPVGSVAKEIHAQRFNSSGDPKIKRGPLGNLMDYPLASFPPQYADNPPRFIASHPDLGPSEVFAQLLRLDQGNLAALTPEARAFVALLRGKSLSEARRILEGRMKGYKIGGPIKAGVEELVAWLNRQFPHSSKSLRTPAIMQEAALTKMPSYGRAAPGVSWEQQVAESEPVLASVRPYLSPETRRLLGEPNPMSRGVWLGDEGMEHNPVLPIPGRGRIRSVHEALARPLAEYGAMLGQDAEGAIRVHPSPFSTPSSSSNAAIIEAMERAELEKMANQGLGALADRSGRVVAVPFSDDPQDAAKIFEYLRNQGIKFRPGISDIGKDRTFGARSGDYADFLYEDVLDASDMDRITAGRIAAETARLGAGRPLPKRRKPR